MSTLTRRSSGNRVPDYKDYMSFVSAYRNGRKESDPNDDNALISPQNDPSKFQPEVSGFGGKVCDSYSSFLEKTKNKKFSSVKPPLGPSTSTKEPPKQTVKVKTEIFLEINNDDRITPSPQEDPISHGQVESKKKMFEGRNKPQNTQSKITTLKQKLENNTQTENNKITEPPRQIIKRINSFNSLNTQPQPNSNCDKSDALDGHKTEDAQNVLNFHLIEKRNNELQRSDSNTKERLIGQLNEALKFKSSITVGTEDKRKDFNEIIQVVSVPKEYSSIPPPPPPMPNGFKPPVNINKPKLINHDQKRATDNKSPPFVSTIPPRNETDQCFAQKNEWNSQKSSTLDRNNPLVRKLAYGAMLDMYGAYHEKANSYVSTLPRQHVRKDNGLQKIIDSIAAQGGLEKLSGRSNPKAENE